MDIKIPDELAAEVAAVAEKSGDTAESLVTEMLTEAIKMRRVPGILFADGATGRRARIEGTGIDVFEVVQAYFAEQGDRAQLAVAFHWLDDRQLSAALDYYRLYPDDVTPYLVHSNGAVSSVAE